MISELIAKLKSKEISAVQLTESYVKNIEEKDSKLNSFVTKTFDQACEDAKKVDELIASSSNLRELFTERPLLGIPFALKDIFSTKDIETTAASNILKGYVPPYDATVVRKIKGAGAIILGKLNCDAFAHGATGENSDFGPTLNPYDLTRVAGGSSSGSGASVAADLTVVATGTDTGGSLRNPASFTNTVAIKPTYGRVSRYGIIAMASSLDSVGHITKTVEDAAQVLQVTAGFDPNDATSSKEETPNYLENIKSGIKGLKIGVPKEYLSEKIDPEILQITKDAIGKFKELGADIKEITLPHSEYAIAVYYIITPSEISSNLGRFDGIRFGYNRDKFGDEAKRRIMLGTYTLSAGFYDAYYLKAQKVRTLIIQDFKNAFKGVDIILGPVSPVLPPRVGENVNDPLKMYLMDILTAPVNLAGLPALSVPAGFSKENLPVGIQLIGDHFTEDKLFRAGYAFEQETKFGERRSGI